MSVPQNISFDRYAQLSYGLLIVADELPLEIDINGVALVTKWLNGGGIWNACYDQVSTTWTACFSTPSTGWSACFAAPSTTWTLLS